jgi:phosphate transport system permease protein
MQMLKNHSRLTDLLMTVAVWLSVALVAGMFLWMLSDLILHGIAKLNWSFLVSEPENAGRDGGIGPILVSTLLILSVALLATIPLGLATAVYLSEYTRRDSALARIIRMSLDVLAGVPSIVFGLFGNALFCIWLGLGFSILSGGLTLACMMLPIFIRLTESGLAAVSIDWRHGAAALGLTNAAALWHVLLPAAAPAITAGLMLSIGRALAETAALIFTSGFVDRMPDSLSDSGRALSVHIYDLSMNVTGGDESAYGSALVLIVLLLVINGIAASLSDRFLNQRIVTL